MGKDTLSVLVAAPEATPLAQTGGLAEVAGSLPLALKELGLDVAVSIPAYRTIMEHGGFQPVARDLPVRVGSTHLTAEILGGELAPGIPAFAVRRDEYFDRSSLYGNSQGEYFDNPERFIFFSRAVPAMCGQLGWTPDVILANDWQTGLIMAMLDLGALPRTAGVFAVHNQAYLGLVPAERRGNIGLPERYYTMEGLEYYGQMSLLKAGIVYSNAVTTVSPTYAREVQTPEGGAGLDGVMRSVSWRLTGILNGVDYHVWNPAADPHLAGTYGPEDLEGKRACKRALLEHLGLSPALMDRPLIGMVTRLAAQKGINILAEGAEEILRMDVGLAVLGSGEDVYEGLLKGLNTRYPDRVGVVLGYDTSLSHQIIAGSDILLMPSMYEPCGLAQIYSLKYGTLPVVRATGGLNDTVMDPEDGAMPGTGFKFGPFQYRALVRAVRRAVAVYEDRDRWRDMMLAGMAQDFSWNRSAKEYVQVFEQALERRRGRR